MPDFTIISMPQCKWCDAAKKLLADRDAAFTEFSISDPTVRSIFIDALGFKTMPQVYHRKMLVGGYEDLERYLNRET